MTDLLTRLRSNPPKGVDFALLFGDWLSPLEVDVVNHMCARIPVQVPSRNVRIAAYLSWAFGRQLSGTDVDLYDQKMRSFYPDLFKSLSEDYLPSRLFKLLQLYNRLQPKQVTYITTVQWRSNCTCCLHRMQLRHWPI
jgi:hypothetical protein